MKSRDSEIGETRPGGYGIDEGDPLCESVVGKVRKRLSGSGRRLEKRPGGTRKVPYVERTGRYQTFLPDPKQLRPDRGRVNTRKMSYLL